MSYPSRPARIAASVLLPLPFGPMIAWTSPSLMVRSIPLRICLPSTPALRFLISSICFIRSALPDTALQAHAQQFLCFDRNFHGHLAKHLFAEPIDNHVNGILRCQSPLVAIKNLIFSNLRSGSLMLHTGGSILGFD